MNENIYSTPQSELSDDKPQFEFPIEIQKKIKNAWIAGIVSASMTALFATIGMFGNSILGIDEWAFIDAGVFILLSFGIYKKSRTCAVLLFLFFLANKIFFITEGVTSGIFVAVIFLWFYAQGIIGTFKYHKLLKSQ